MSNCYMHVVRNVPNVIHVKTFRKHSFWVLHNIYLRMSNCYMHVVSLCRLSEGRLPCIIAVPLTSPSTCSVFTSFLSLVGGGVDGGRGTFESASINELSFSCMRNLMIAFDFALIGVCWQGKGLIKQASKRTENNKAFKKVTDAPERERPREQRTRPFRKWQMF